MPLCFAYGSNMDRAAMAARCPNSKPLGVGRLPRHRFVIMPEGYADVARDPRGVVYGVLWEIALADMRALDAYENISSGLYRKVMQPILREGAGGARALVYMGRGLGGGRPKPGYLEGVLAAARSWELPPAYLRDLETSAGRTIARAPRLPSVTVQPGLELPPPMVEPATGAVKVRPRFSTPFDRR